MRPLQDPPLLRRHRFPIVQDTPPMCSRRVLRSSTSSGRPPQCCTVPTIGSGTQHPPGGAAVVWCASSTGMTPMTGQILLAGKGCRTLVCGWPRVTPTTPFSYLGSPCTDSLDLLSPAFTLGGVPQRMWQGCPGNTPRTCPAPGTSRGPMRHRILPGLAGQGPAFQRCFASAATRADTHTSHHVRCIPLRHH